MTDRNDVFLADDDAILASILEESLRHYNEVEVPLRAAVVDPIPRLNSNTKTVNSSTVVDLSESPKKCQTVQSRLSHFFKKSKTDEICIVDLCESPKKHQTVQSRLSHFFRKPTGDDKYNTESNNELKNQTDKFPAEISFSPAQNNDNSFSLQSIFYKESDADGFHLSSGSHFVYPSNFPVREYQMTIIKTALFHNTLVSLPTGMGKTFIGAVVMYNFYRWYPMGKIVFMAPTRPLVAQQIEACHSIMGIPKDMTFEMTGNIPPEQRYLAWKKYRVFFLTPQVMANDLSLDKCPSEMLKCIIVDEAHRATKDYAYVQVLKRLKEENRKVRIVGLSATPGTNVESVTEVIRNLNIARLEFRTNESPDVAKYTNKKDVECIPVKLTSSILNIRTQFLTIYDKYSRRLKQYRALHGNITNLSKFQLLGAKQKFVTSNLAREMPNSLVGCLINDFTICMSLAYALELLVIYGIKVFYLQLLELLDNHKCLSNDVQLQNILNDINRELKSQDLTWSHPKMFELKKIVQDYFGIQNTEKKSKIIIFCQYRLVVVEVFELLKTFGSFVKPVMFVGQSSKEKGGLPQKKQLEVMSRFKSGEFNVLIATSVAEEGLDIGEVDLIICLEANKSPIKFVQRMGRTGRKRSGKCITLLTEGKEQSKYNCSVSSSKTLVVKMLKNKTILSKLSEGGPRLIPKHINPQCLMIHVKKSEEILPEIKQRKGKRKANENIMPSLAHNNSQNEGGEENEEEGINVFQSNKEKTKKRSKKRKTAELETNDNCREVIQLAKEKNTNLDVFEYNLIDNEFNVPEINALTTVESDCNENNSNHFVNEDNAFNEWLSSCEQTNSVVMNEQFFKLLNFFTECSTMNDIVLCSDDVSLKCNIDSKLNHPKKTNFNYTFKSQLLDENSMKKKQTNNVHELLPRNQKKSRNQTVRIGQPSTSIVSVIGIECDKINTITKLQSPDDESAKKTITEDLFKSQKHHVSESFNFNQSFCLNDGRKSPIVSSGKYKSKNSIEYDQNGPENKFDFDQLFRSQRSENYDKNNYEKLDDTYDRQSTNYDFNDDWQKSKYNVDTNKLDEDFDESSSDMVKVIESDKDEDQDEMANINIEDLFKSQRANAYIEKYNANIINEQLTSDSDDSIILINDLQNNPMGLSNRCIAGTSGFKTDGTKLVEKVVDLDDAFIEKSNENEITGRSSRYSSISSKQKSPEIGHCKNMPDTLSCKSHKEHKRKEKLDDLFKVQHVNRNIGDYMERVMTDVRLPKDSTINLVDDEEEKVIHRGNNVDLEDIFKSQRANRYIDNSMDKILLTPSKNVVDDNAVEEDDIISIDNSPEFFSCRLPKQIVQTKLSDCVRSSTTAVATTNNEVIDLLTPEFADNHLVQKDKSTNDVPQSNDDKSIHNNLPLNDFVDDNDMDFMFIDYCSGLGSGTDAISKKNETDNSNKFAFTEKEPFLDRSPDVFTNKPQNSASRNSAKNARVRLERDSDNSSPDIFTQNHQVSDDSSPNFFTLNQQVVGDRTKMAVRTTLADTSPSQKLLDRKRLAATGTNVIAETNQLPLSRNDDLVKVTAPAQPYRSDLVPFNIMKACNLFKPGFSLKRNTTSTTLKSNPRPINNKLLSTTKASTLQQSDVSPIAAPAQRQRPYVQLTSSSDDSPPISLHRVRKNRRIKPKKKLLFIDDEADVSNNFNDSTTGMVAPANKNTSSDDDDEDYDFDSSFIDDDQDKSEPSTSMTEQYLQSVKSPFNARGVFKIPVLSRHHYDINVCSQMPDKNDSNSYEEDSFCVKDESDLNTSSNTSAQKTPDERPSRLKKRKRIICSESTDNDSPDQFCRNNKRKRIKAKMNIDLSD